MLAPGTTTKELTHPCRTNHGVDSARWMNPAINRGDNGNVFRLKAIVSLRCGLRAWRRKKLYLMVHLCRGRSFTLTFTLLFSLCFLWIFYVTTDRNDHMSDIGASAADEIQKEGLFKHNTDYPELKLKIIPSAHSSILGGAFSTHLRNIPVGETAKNGRGNTLSEKSLLNETYGDMKKRETFDHFQNPPESGDQGSVAALIKNGRLGAQLPNVSSGSKEKLELSDPDTFKQKSSDFLFSPCDGPDLPEVKPDPAYGFVGPFRYLANYKNPCWMESRVRDVRSLHCVPYFYLAGAPKAGSTDLYQRICMHPEVVRPRSKETRWFDRTRFEGKSDFMHFLSNFQNSSSVIARSLERGSNFHKRIIGDGSPSYFFDNRHWTLMPGNERCSEPRVTVASHIHHLFPGARVIFILRNPVDRMYSSYLYNHAKYGPVSSQVFDLYVRQSIQVYKECFAQHSLRQCANNATVFKTAKIMLIVSLYSVFLRDWLSLFPRNQVFVLTTEKYNKEMETQLRRVFTFLDLRTLNSEEMKQIVDVGVHNKGQHYKRVGPMMPATRSLLEDFFRPYNRELAQLLKNPDFLWK